MKKMKGLLLATLVILQLDVVAGVTVAIIDSGTDIQHQDLKNQVWRNPGEIPGTLRDDDGNGYPDDVYGWNFAENNNVVLDRRYIGSFSDDPYIFFDIQRKMFLNEQTQRDLEWLEEKREDGDFRKEMGIFGNFIHGTHVAHIAARISDKNKIMSIKLLPTSVRSYIAELAMQAKSGGGNGKGDDYSVRWNFMELTLRKIAEAQAGHLAEVFSYVGNFKAPVANGSFGTGFEQASMIINGVFRAGFFRRPTEAELLRAYRYFMKQLLGGTARTLSAFPDTLFVFAAGNDGTNNDILPASPTNVNVNNKISVAATFNYDALAGFSNYGVETVDVAAPGVIIDAAIPGNEYLQVSGTSQAAPFVAGVVGAIKEINPRLSSVEIKSIIMGTVDKKDFLISKVKAGGIVNFERATTAANLSRGMNVIGAIRRANEQIADVQTTPGAILNRAMTELPGNLLPMFEM